MIKLGRYKIRVALIASLLFISNLFIIYHKHQKQKKHPIFSQIHSINIDGNNIKIICELQDINLLISHIVVKSIAFQKPIYFINDSFSIHKINPKTYNLKINAPFITTYKCTLYFLATPVKYNRVKCYVDTSEYIYYKKFKFTLNSFNDQTFSQLKCYGHSMATRWCDSKNVYLYKNKIIIYTKALYKFPSPFMKPGTRAPPYDRQFDRFYDEPIVSHIPPKINYNISSISYIVGRFYNPMMLWHVLYDFTVPLWSTILDIEKDNIRNNRRIFLKDYEWDVFKEFFWLLSSELVVNASSTLDNYYFSHAVIGMKNFEGPADPDRNYFDMINYQYNFSRKDGIGLREFVLNKLRIDDVRPKSPRVVVLHRGGDKRDISNVDEIVNFLKNECPLCDVARVNLVGFRMREQISLLSHASALIGLHGSGLSHTLWMNESTPNNPTALFEILPHNYWCRKWYGVAANVAGVEYYGIEDKKKPQSNEGGWKPFYCHTFRCACKNMECHDWLRDRLVSVNMKQFASYWKTFQKKLLNSYNVTS